MANKKRQLMQFTEVLRISVYTLAKKSCALFRFFFFSLETHGIILADTLQVTYFLQSPEVESSYKDANSRKDLIWMYTVVIQ